MQIIVQSQTLTKHLAIVKTAISNTQTMPILSSFLFDVANNQIKITGTDLETTLSAIIECECTEQISFCIESDTLMELMKAISSQPITLKIDKEIEIVTSSGNYNMPISDAKEFPTFAKIEEASKLSIPAHILNAGLTKTSFAIGTDDLRQMLCGVCFDIKTDRLIFVGTNANMLVKYTRTDVTSQEENQFILPRKPIAVLKTALSGLDCEVEMTYNVQNVEFSFENFNLICRLIDAKYPAYDSVIPKENPITLQIRKTDLLGSLKRISIFSNKSTHQISLDKKPNEIVLVGEDVDYSNKGVETLMCSTDGDDLKIGFNSRFLSEMLSNMSDGDIKLSMSAPNRAGILTPIKENSEFEETLMLVMPVMLN
jgi:DNA polymerase-3 subunit beta